MTSFIVGFFKDRSCTLMRFTNGLIVVPWKEKERETETETERDRETERQRERQRERDRERGREAERASIML